MDRLIARKLRTATARTTNLPSNYDRNGNATGHGGNTLSYNARNHWTGATVNGQSVGFGYDGAGRRVSRTVGTARTDYWYDGTGMSLETGAASAEYTRSPGGELLSRVSSASVVNYSGNDQGSVTALTSTSGSVVSSYAYDPWGEEIASSGTAYNPYGYTGTYLDSATGLYQMGARYYQSDTGSFTQQDPLPSSYFEGNRYGYTGANPVNFADPSGLHRVCGGLNRTESGFMWARIWLGHCTSHKMASLLTGTTVGDIAATSTFISLSRTVLGVIGTMVSVASASYYLLGRWIQAKTGPHGTVVIWSGFMVWVRTQP